MTVFSKDTRSHLTKRAFLDGPLGIARYDEVKYPQFDKLTEKQWGFFWRPQEVALEKDKSDFESLSPHEQHIFTSNLKRQILLDSVQGRAPGEAFGKICSLPELEIWIKTWEFFELIHSKSYSWIIKRVYSNPSIVFDEINTIPEILECADDISKYYDELIELNNSMNHPRYENLIPVHKEALWMGLNATNFLEGIRFYVSFACSWAFAELKKMEGNAKIIKFIARDENIHLGSTQQLLKILPTDDPDFAAIRTRCRPEVLALVQEVVDQEKAWAKYLFKDGSVIGLNEKLLCSYVEWIADKRLVALGYQPMFGVKSNPLPWTQKWIAGSDVQVAPQETEITSYVVGGVDKDVSVDTFKGFSL